MVEGSVWAGGVAWISERVSEPIPAAGRGRSTEAGVAADVTLPPGSEPETTMAIAAPLTATAGRRTARSSTA